MSVTTVTVFAPVLGRVVVCAASAMASRGSNSSIDGDRSCTAIKSVSRCADRFDRMLLFTSFSWVNPLGIGRAGRQAGRLRMTSISPSTFPYCSLCAVLTPAQLKACTSADCSYSTFLRSTHSVSTLSVSTPASRSIGP